MLKSFEEYLVEGRQAPLYHGTKRMNVREILMAGIIEPRTIHYGGKLMLKMPANDGSSYYRGVSLTRNINLARKFYAPTGDDNYIIQLDQRKLTNNFKIIPVQYYDMGVSRSSEYKTLAVSPKNEYEEFVLTKVGIPIKYITAILYPKNDMPNLIRVFNEYGMEAIKDNKIALEPF